MMRWWLMLLALLTFGTTGAAAQAGEPVLVTVETSAGAVTLALDAEHAPKTTANFLRYVDAKRLDGATFYRAMRHGAEGGLIQGGIGGDPKRSFPPVAHEATSETGLRHEAGTLSMARYAPGTAAGEFFILATAMPSLDADPQAPGDNAGFAAFGTVVDGMDVVRAILAAPVSATKGEGVMKGQMLDPEIRILSVRRVPAPPAR